MGSSKGGGAPVAPPAESSGVGGSNDATALMLMQLMQQQQAQNSNQPPPALLDAPPITTATQTDWTEKQTQLASKVRATAASERNKRRGRASTILTSPLLDEEDIVTTESILTGE